MLRDLARELAGAEEPPALLAPGSLLAARFEVETEIGRGGFGVVYSALDRELGRPVAIKIMHRALAAAGYARDLKHEAAAVARLNHPNIVTLHDLGEWEGRSFLVMELLRGETLSARLRRATPTVGETLDIAREVLRALVHAHAAGVVHRDLKPSNVFLQRDGTTKVLDFGLAHGTPEALPRSGTPAYMAPEQWRGEALDGRADVFSLGVMLFEMATGVLPTQLGEHGPGLRPDAAALLRDVVGLPAALLEAIMAALTRAPEARTSAPALLGQVNAIAAARERPRLADRLRLMRHMGFVGRAAELAVLAGALHGARGHVFYVHGPGGIGKTSVLRELMWTAEQSGVTVAYCDLRHVQPLSEAFVAAIASAIGAPEGVTDPIETLCGWPVGGARHVVLLDTFETMTPIEPWVRESFLPRLPEHVLVIMAGRAPPSPGWRTDPGWRAIGRTLELRALSAEESRELLARRSVPAPQVASVLAFAHGHPLALALTADLFEAEPDHVFRPDAAHDLIEPLLRLFLDTVDGPLIGTGGGANERAALEACAVVRTMTEPLLAAMLALEDEPAGDDTARKLFAWLAGLSFFDRSGGGLFPHDLAREVIASELRWRNAPRHAHLIARAHAYYFAHLVPSGRDDAARPVLDVIYLHRHHPQIRRLFEWAGSADTTLAPLAEADKAVVSAMVERHEGPASAAIVRHWCERQPQAFVVIRGPRGACLGFQALLSLEAVTAEDLAVDPALHAIGSWLAHSEGMHAGDASEALKGAITVRYRMAHETYQDVSAVMSICSALTTRHALSTPGLRAVFLAFADPALWAPLYEYLGLPRVSDADFEVGGHRYAVFMFDFRRMSAAEWITSLALRAVS